MIKLKMPKIYTEYLLSNIVLTVLIVIFLIGFILPGFSEKERKEQIRQAQAFLAEQRSWLDERILDSEKLLYTFLQDPAFAEICRMEAPYGTQELDSIRSFVNGFDRYRIMQDNLDSITLFLGKSQLFLDTGNAGTEPELFYNSRFGSKNQPYEEWLAERFEVQDRIEVRETRQADGKGDQFLLYNRSSQSLFDNPLLLIASFTENPYTRYVKNSLYFAESELLAVDGEGRTVFNTMEEGAESVGLSGNLPVGQIESGGQIKLRGVKYTVILEESELADIRYFWLIPNSLIYQQTGRDVMAVLLTGALLTAAFVMMAVYLAYRNSQPIYEFVKRIADKSTDPESELFLDSKNVNGSLEKVVRRNNFLKEELKKYIQNSKIIFFTKLLNGVPMSQLEIISVNQHLDNFLYYRRYQVALLHLDMDSYKNSDLVRMMVEDTIRQNSPQYCYVVQTEINRFAVVFASNCEEEASVVNGLEKLMKALEKDGTVQYTCILSTVSEVPEQLYNGYQSCCQAFDMLESRGEAFAGRLIRMEEVAENDRGYYYPVFEEQSLMNCIAGHKYDAAAECIERLFHKNYDYRTISARERQYFVENLCSTFLRVMRGKEIYGRNAEQYVEDSIYQIRQTHRRENIYSQFTGILNYLEKNEKAHPQNKTEQICAQIEEMIGKRFGEPDFSIMDIAAELHLSENYVSAIFRQNNGSSIAATIERVRMNRAGELVKETDEYIKEIAERTGYLNLNTFYKAFKRYYGVTPSKYREMNRV